MRTAEEMLKSFVTSLDREMESAVREETHKLKERLAAKEAEISSLRDKADGLEREVAHQKKLVIDITHKAERLQGVINGVQKAAGEAQKAAPEPMYPLHKELSDQLTYCSRLLAEGKQEPAVVLDLIGEFHVSAERAQFIVGEIVRMRNSGQTPAQTKES